MTGKLNINIRFVSDRRGSSGAVKAEKFSTTANEWARFIVRNVAISAAESNRLQMQRKFVKSVQATADRATNQMASAIGNFFANPYKYGGPYHNMSIKAAELGISLSDTGRASGFRDTQRFNTSQSGIKWKRWSQRYEKHKKKYGNADRWFVGSNYKRASRATSEHLQDYLRARSGSFYEKAFGPVRVRFTRTSGEKFTSVSGQGLTRTGAGGKLAYTVQVGRIQIEAFNKITPAIMPGLANLTPVGSNPLPGAGVASLLSKAYPRNRQLVKLMGKSTSASYYVSKDKKVPASDIFRKIWRKKYRMVKVREKRTPKGSYRPALDPFVSFYLTRVIPNAIFRRLEQEAQFSGG